MGGIDKIKSALSEGAEKAKILYGDRSDFKNFKKPANRQGNDFLQLYQDPTYLCFKLLFPQSDIEGDAGTIGLLGGPDNTNSALYYLKKMGDMARFRMLVDFKSLLQKLNSEYPWYFQSIEGLGDAWKRDLSKPKFTKEITINCLESIDLRVTGLMDLYRKITIDFKNRRYILPENLRKFEMTVKIYDFRDFGTTTTGIKRLEGLGIDVSALSGSPFLKDASMNESFLGAESLTDRTQISFDLSHCEFEANDSGEIFSTISNATPTMVEQKIKIKYQNIEENNLYKILTALGNHDKNYYVRDYLQSELQAFGSGSVGDASAPQAGNFIKDAIAALASGVAANVSKRAANALKSKLNSLLLGNVYGISPLKVINNLSSGDAIADSIAGISVFPKKETNPILGNIYGKGSNLPTPDAQEPGNLGNVYGVDTDNPPTPDAQGPVDLGNVYD
tara:strand:+ start:762 stop:2105 length:1344 start_codon:yes stop_codon:yes gene_type:complete